jgi:phosphotransferase system enzyme I (PtsI)
LSGPIVKPKPGQRLIKGIADSPGVAIGKVCIHKDIFAHVAAKPIEDHQIGAEIQNLKKAIRAVGEAIRNDQDKLRRRLGVEASGDAEIFSAHLFLLEDPHFLSEIFAKVATLKINAEAAVLSEIRRYEEVFGTIEEASFKERILDIGDIGKRLIEALSGPIEFDCPFDEAVIIAGIELMPKDTVHFARERVKAFVTEKGGKESHAAILARSMGIPAGLGVEGLLSRIEKGDSLIVDGNLGFVVINPPEKAVREYQEQQERIEARRRDLERLVSLPAETADGRRFKLMANIGNMIDLEFAAHYRTEGVGLFRTELPFMAGGRFLNEEEQFQIYRKAVEAMKPNEVTIRTLDFGGDKVFASVGPEKNPFLGYRSTRAFLKHPEMLRTQLRAICRTGAHGNVKILFPMVSSVDEVRQLRGVLQDVARALAGPGADPAAGIPVGVMVEVPSLAIMASNLMKVIDFVSIDTNDLVQYALAVDRDNHLVSDLYQPLDPAVLWLIKNVVDAGRSHGKSVAICGEMAGDPACFPLLYGLGLREFSVAPVSTLEIKDIARRVTEREASAIAAKALAMDSPRDVERLLKASNKKFQKA